MKLCVNKYIYPWFLKRKEMAGVMNEPTPLKSTFCAILKEEQYCDGCK